VVVGLGARHHALTVERRLASCWPGAIEVQPDLLAVDDHCVRVFAVKAWPREVMPGWLAPLVDGPEPVTVVVFFWPLASADQVARLTRRLVMSRGAEAARARTGRLADPEGSQAIEDADTLRRDLVSGRTRLVRVGLGLAVQANTRAELEARTDRLLSLSEGLLLMLGRGRFRQLDLLRGMMPGAMPVGSHRDMDSQAAATLFPILGDERQDADGELWGENAISHAPVLINRQSLPAPHSMTVAWSGAGKSFATKLLILRARYHGYPVVVIDPEGEYRNLAPPQNRYTLGAGAGLNPLFQVGDEPTERARRAEFGATWLETLAGSLPASFRRALVHHLYGQAARTVSEWRDALRRDLPALASRVDAALERWMQVMGREASSISADGLTVLDLSALPHSVRTAAYLVCLEYVLATLRDRRPRWVVFDEAWRLLTHERLASYLEELYRRARKWRTTLMLVTQDAEDALRSASAQVCLRNSPLVLLLKPHPDALDRWRELFHLSGPETEWLQAVGIGEGLLIADRHRIPIRIEASPMERQLIQEAEQHARPD
jgi:conjugal transfer ATP-binding protein TraC